MLLAACAPLKTQTPAAPIPSATPSQTPPVVNEAQPLLRFPFPQHVQYHGGILPNHRSQAQLDEDVRAAYWDWKARYVIEDGGLYRIAFGKDEPARATTVSEGQGYGMVIVALMAGEDPEAQKIFDGLQRFAAAHPSEIDARLMDWNVPEPQGNASAFDGDADIAYGLLLADAQWGSSGEVNYKAEALKMMDGILESEIGAESRLPTLGDWVREDSLPYSQFTPRSSDFMLTNFRAYGKAGGGAVWDEVVAQSQTVMLEIQNEFSPQSGLLPDFIVKDESGFTPAPPNFLEAETDDDYNYNAGRAPWRVGLDALLFGDETSRAIVLKISHWAESAAQGDPYRLNAGYHLDGQPLDNSEYFTTFFLAPLGVAAMNDSNQQAWLNAIYDSVYAQRLDYYEDSVTLLCLLAMSGNAWTP